MRPLDPHAPGLSDMDHRLNAQVQQGVHDFWDHLSLTRAQEYADDDALALLPIQPAPELPAQEVPAPGMHGHNPAWPAPGAGYGAVGPVAPASPVGWPDAWPAGPHGLAEPEAAQAGFGAGPALPIAAPPITAPHRSMHAPKPRAGTKASGRTTGRFAYRAQRIWLTPLYRRAITLGLPLALLVATITLYLLDEGRRGAIAAQGAALYAMVVDRPEFMVTELRIAPVAPAIDTAIRAVLDPHLPQSSFRLDLVALRAELERIDAIRLADLRLSAERVLTVSITERVPAILWRSAEGLEVLDAEGVRIGFVTDRAALPDLMLIAGEGANRRVGEALDLIEAASPLRARLLGLVHVGERRWDVVLDRDQVIRLPETGAVAALERVIAHDQAQDLLARDIVTADMRNPGRLVLQVSAGALETIRALRGTP